MAVLVGVFMSLLLLGAIVPLREVHPWSFAVIGDTSTTDHTGPAADSVSSITTGGAPTPALMESSGRSDLAVASVVSRDNRLLVVLENRGDAEVEGPIYISVDGRMAHRVDATIGSDGASEVFLEDEYVQRRGNVTVVVDTLNPPVPTTHRSFQGIVAPDLPNDLNLVSAGTELTDGHVFALVRNDSTIPLVGTITIAVRVGELPGQLAARVEARLDVDSGGTQRFDLETLLSADTTNWSLIMSTDAIADDRASNDSYHHQIGR
jgi:hypothetical protein